MPESPFLEQLESRYEELTNRLPAGINELTGAVIGAPLEVHQHLGPGFPEWMYEDALCLEMSTREISFARQVVIPVAYKGRLLGEFQADLVVDGRLVVELKAVGALAPVHYAQLLAYLRATTLPLGLLLNFNVARLRDGISRVINPQRI